MTRVPVTVRHSSLPFFPRWVAATVPAKRTILVREGFTLDRRLLAHELRHVTQAEHAAWPLAYVIQWARSGFSYTRMPYEREARAAERDERYLAWADDLLAGVA